MRNKLIIYELNELPPKLLEYFIANNPDSNLSKLKKNGSYLKTFTTDRGELHPWTTWATFYRGVDNSVHKINSLNQERISDKNYPPIWEILIKKNISIGIFGSLQSYPPIINNNVKFYLPDTFSPSNDAVPSNLETFQKFNLDIVSNNSGEIRKIRKIDIKHFFDCILKSNIRIGSLFKILLQTISERVNKRFRRRRSLLQPHLTFDIYIRYLKKYKPDFSTFFTNHLAGMMHYYWLDIFPMDFKNPYRVPKEFNKKSIIKALKIADKQIGLLMSFAESNGYQLWLASSMGQQAIERKEFPRLFIKDFLKMLEKLNLNKILYKLLPSMYPDLNIESKNEEELDILIETLLQIKFQDNHKSIFKVRYRENSKMVNLIFNVNSEKSDYIYFKNKKINVKDLGLEYGIIEQGTGYHMPEGILLMQGKKSKFLFKNLYEVDTKDIFSYIMKIFGLKVENKYIKSL